MKKLIRLSIIIFLCSCVFLLTGLKSAAQVSGVKTIPGDYASITQAIQQIRAVGVSGPTFLELQAGYNSAVETFPIKIREISGTSSVNSITISPAAGATGLSITADNSEAIIDFIGAYNITIDGRAGRTGFNRELTIRNNSGTGKIINFYDGAVDNSVTFCKLEGAAISASSQTSFVYFGRSTEPIPDGILLENTDNMMSNCIISGNNSLNTVSSVVYAVGSTSVLNIGNKIIDNEIMNFRWAIYIPPDGGGNWTITGNSFYNLFNIGSQSFIYFRPGSGSFNNIISGNFIGGLAARAEGGQAVATDNTGASIYGMVIDAGSVIIENNVIQSLKVESTRSVSFTGISLEKGSAQISGNRIGGSTELNGILISGPGNFYGIVSTSCSPVIIEDNRFSNIAMQGNSTKWFRGIMFRAGSGTVVTGNQVDQIISSGTGAVNFTAIGIFPTIYPDVAECPASPQPSVIDHNLINNITLSSDDDSATFSGVEIFGTGGPASQLHNNQVYRINVSAPDGIASFSGIHINDRISANTGNIIGSATEANSIMISGKIANGTAILVNESPDVSISDDIIGNIKVNGTQSASLDGIRFQGGGISKASGNQLNDLSVNSTGSSTMVAISFNGAVTSNESSTLHNNKVYKVNVSSTEGTASFAGIVIIDRIAGNTGNIIGSSTDANSIMVTGKSAFANGVHLKNSPDVSVSDDIIANISAIGTLTQASVNGILFEAGSIVKISGNQVHHLTAPNNKGIFINPSNGSSTVTLDSNTVTGANNNTGTGFETFVAAEASLNLMATNNTVSNWQNGVLLAAAPGATLQQSFQNNAVVANQTGFINEIGTPVNATCNWWGDASGPSGAGTGTGNPVGPNVIFSPWATLSTYVAVNAGPDQTITGSGSKTLIPTYTVCGTATYLWSTGANTPSITVSPTVTTVYSIKITDANGHEATDEVKVFVQAVSLPKISIVSTAVAEGNSGSNNAVFILVLSKLSAVPVTVQYQTSNITATTPQDYFQKSGTITFPANSLVGLIQTITIQVKGDVLPETDETFRVLLSNAVNATINITSATCTIVDNDPPCLRINDATATENSGQAVITVSLSSASSKTVTVKYDTKDGTAKAPGDYTKVNGTLTFQPGETTKTITIVIKKDALNNESTEKFQVILKYPENASIGTTTACTARKDATVSIINSSSQQSREVLTKQGVIDNEAKSGITVPGLLSKRGQLTIQGLKGTDNELEVFDSRGIIVAKLLQYKNSWSPVNLVQGIYFYQLRIRSREGIDEVYRGKIFITD